jgi:hypothetical protein
MGLVEQLEKENEDLQAALMNCAKNSLTMSMMMVQMHERIYDLQKQNKKLKKKIGKMWDHPKSDLP